MKAVVLTFDQLSLSYLGCYGNEWIETPNFNRLAARSVVFDQHFGENFSSTSTNHAWWTGCYQFLIPPHIQNQQPTLFEFLSENGVSTHLFRSLSEHDSTETVPTPAEFEAIEHSHSTDIEHSQTPFARLIQQAESCLTQLADKPHEPALLWLKSLGVPEMLQPPPEPFGSLYLDELDEDNESDASLDFPPEEEIASQKNQEVSTTDTRSDSNQPSELTETDWQQYRLIYAGYVSLLDWWLGQLLDTIERTINDEPLLLIVTAASGDYTGEREWLDTHQSPEAASQTELHEEIIHTPLLISCTDGNSQGSRRQSLVQTVDIMPTLLDWFKIDPNEASIPCQGLSLIPFLSGQPINPREYICLGEGITPPETSDDSFIPQTTAIRTNNLLMINFNEHLSADHDNPTITNPEEATRKLFVKPDDIWEVHDVAAQSPQDVQALDEKLLQFIKDVRN